MLIPITYPSVSAFDQHLLRISQLLLQLSTPSRWSILTLPTVSKEVQEIYCLQISILDDLQQQQALWLSLYNADKVDLIQSITPSDYKSLRQVDDYLSKVLAVTEAVKGFTPDIANSFSAVVDWAVKRVFSIKIQRTNKKTIRVVKQQQYISKKVLAKLDQVSFAPTVHFEAIPADQLWKERCLAYDYLA